MAVPGISKPMAPKTAVISLAKPMPASTPMSDETRPIRRASSSTDRSTCRLLAPMVRSMANSRMRCETVIEKVLKMMNPPTNTAAPANASSSGVRKLLMLPATWSVWLCAASAEVSTFTSFGMAC